ncbi:unnamed protein product [Paramecium pentaurelia]|uniref:Uncharacterized protein n=1 Tax=Paramecium pentaurelia TaxID=43138 RepID=A0A8S1WEU0_9CILI|nr:unnamed protein product [Paramecium pentaurelia]
MFNLYSQRGSIIEKDRIKSQGNTLNVPRTDSLLTDQKHKGCLQRINILIQELDRMSEAQKMANLEIQHLQKEIEKLQRGGNQLNQLSTLDEQGKEEELRLEKQKFHQYKQLKEQQIIELENDLIKTHKELKEEKLIRLDLNHRFEIKCQEVERLKQEIEKLQIQSNSINNGGILNQLHGDLIQFQNENKELKQINIKQQSQIDKLLEGSKINQQINQQYYETQKITQQSLEEALFPSTKINPIKKMNRALTIQPIEPYYNKSLYQSNRLSINYPQQQFKIENNEQEQENDNSYEHQYHSNTKRKEYSNNNCKVFEDTQRTISKQYNQF